MTEWFVYIIRCSDKSLYTGISTNVEKRFAQHANSQGAKYFRGRSPVSVVFQEGGHDRCSATKREMEIKKMSRDSKLKLIDLKYAD